MRNEMQDHSHRFLFLGATAIMCAVAVYGSQAGPAMLLPEDRPASTIAQAPFVASTEAHGPLRRVSFRTSESAPQTHTDSPLDEAAQPGTASVVPNDASCPAADAAALISPPSVGGAIGSPTPIERTVLPRQGLTGAALGTGSSCPPARDGSVQKIPSAAADSLNRKAAGAMPGGVSRP
jgi:hypothetical protein